MGVSFFITDTQYDKKNYVYYTMNGLYKAIWRFAPRNKWKIKVKENYQDLPLLCQADVPLMSIFNRTFKNVQFKFLNYVQKYLEAYSLANITTIDGKYISHLAWTAEESNSFRSVI